MFGMKRVRCLLKDGAEVTYSKVRVGSIALTETEFTFEGDPSKINDFLTKFRAISLRNWG